MGHLTRRVTRRPATAVRGLLLAVVLAGCGSSGPQRAATAASTSTVASTLSPPTSTSTTTVPLSPLQACQNAFHTVEVSPDPASPPAPYTVCDHHDFFQVTLQEAAANSSGYDFGLYGGSNINSNCANYWAQGIDPLACRGVTGEPPNLATTPTTTVPPEATTTPPPGTPSTGAVPPPAAGPVTTVSPPVTGAGIPSGATAKCVDGTFSFSQDHSGTCAGHGGVDLWL